MHLLNQAPIFAGQKKTFVAPSPNAVRHFETGITGILGPWLRLGLKGKGRLRRLRLPLEQAEPAIHRIPRRSPGTRMLDGVARRPIEIIRVVVRRSLSLSTTACRIVGCMRATAPRLNGTGIAR